MTRLAVDIAAPAAEVYARIADPRQRPAWLPELQATSELPDGRALEAGDRFVGYAALLGHRFVGHSEVVVADHAAARLEERVVIGARFRTSWTVTATGERGDTCRVIQDIDVEFPQGPIGTVERWVLNRYLNRLQREGLDRLAELTSPGATRSGSSQRRRWRWWPRRSARSFP